MNLERIYLNKVKEEFLLIKPDLIDAYANYIGCFNTDSVLVGIAGWVEHEHVIYLCHDYVKEEHRGHGIYKLLCNYRNFLIGDTHKEVYAHCNQNSLKEFINQGYKIEKVLFKVVK
jgi:hypothetical protein